MTPKARVLAAFPNAKCTKDVVTRRVVITLGAMAHDHYMHKDTDRFEFAYGTATEMWAFVGDKLKLPWSLS